MTPMTASQITDLHARRTAKGSGFAPSLNECLDAARAGMLYDVDTQNAGYDCLSIADSEDDALSGVVSHYDLDAWTAYPYGGAAYARSLRWSAERITLTEGTNPAAEILCVESDTEITATPAIEILYVESDCGLYHRYDGQGSAQDCYIWLDCETSQLGASHDAETGNAIPFAVYYGHTQRWSIPALKADAANALLEEIAPLAARVIAGYSSEWDGSNFADFDADAEAARDEITALCERATNSADESDCVNVWDAGSWYGAAGSRDQQRAELGITAATTDAELDEIETREDASARADGCDVIEGHADYLRRLRDEAVGEALV